MTCPSGCLRKTNHKGFHTTNPAVAEKEDLKERADKMVKDAFAWAKEKVELERGK